jgi:D-alanine-D-alanine ligase
MKIAILSDPSLISQIESKEGTKSKESKEPTDNIQDDDSKPPLVRLQDALRDFENKISFIALKFDALTELQQNSFDLILNTTNKISTNNRPAQFIGLLELTRIPFCGSQMDSVSICKNKPFFKSLLQLNSIATPKFQILKIQGGKIPKIRKDFKFPLILKFYHAGIHTQSILDKIITNLDELQENLKSHLKKSRTYVALAEEYIRISRKIYLPILGNELNGNIHFLPAIETIHSKEEELQARLISNSNGEEKKFLELTDPLVKRARKIAIKAYNFFNCHDYAMFVFILDKKSNNLLLHEINPITSLLPKGKIAIAAEHLGISYSEIINDIILSTLLRYDVKLKGKYAKRFKNMNKE